MNALNSLRYVSTERFKVFRQPSSTLISNVYSSRDIKSSPEAPVKEPPEPPLHPYLLCSRRE
jgi:hypothetical protein